jgi:TatD DNase family protein
MTLPVPAPPPLSEPVIDSHCHLDIIADYSALQPGDALAAAAHAGVSGVVQVGVNIGSSHRSVEFAHEYDNVVASVGVHPNEAPTRADRGHLSQDLATLAHMAEDNKVVAIGETGLDHYRTDESGRETQEMSFREHIRLARSLDKTLIIHDREAHDDVMRVLESEDLPDRVVFHCFSGGPELARRCIDGGFYLSFAGTVTFRNAHGLREAAEVVPPKQLLVETDAPFLTPMPHRGKPNASYLLPWTVRFLAEQKGCDEAYLCKQLRDNTLAAFGISEDVGFTG